MNFLSGWGNYPRYKVRIHQPASLPEIIETVRTNQLVIAHGNGKSYGDSALQKDVIDLKKLNNIIEFDENEGIIIAEAGILLKQILAFIVPKSYFLCVLPGTQFITLGGAIAADIHGKDHPFSGNFSEHVEKIWVLDENGSVIICSKQINSDLFWNTCGGMGKTGIIIKAQIKLRKINTSKLLVENRQFNNLNDLLFSFDNYEDSPYKVAWLDLANDELKANLTLARTDETAQFNKGYEKSVKGFQSVFSIPFFFPTWFLNPKLIKLFNYLYFFFKSRSSKVYSVEYYDYFFVLDKIRNWNKIYGRSGFLQYQFVLPENRSLEGIERIITYLKKNNITPYLVVLKKLGEINNHAVNSFPMPGFSLALDFKYNKKILTYLDDLDDIVIAFGGRVYLAKDARMGSKSFDKMYPESNFNNEKYISYQIERYRTSRD